MNLKKWLSIILVTGLFLAINSLSAQADPWRPYWHPHGKAHGWERHHDFDHFDRHRWHSCRGSHGPRYVERVYTGPPAVAYVQPAPVIGIPYAQPQPYYSKPGLSGTLQYNF